MRRNFIDLRENIVYERIKFDTIRYIPRVIIVLVVTMIVVTIDVDLIIYSVFPVSQLETGSAYF